MPDIMIGAVWAFCWGAAAASGALIGVLLGFVTRLRHRAIAAFMSLGAGVLLSAASFKVASEALVLAGAPFIVAGIVAGAATFSLVNALLKKAKHRKRCGECQPQPTGAEVPGSGVSISLGTALDAMPEALVLGASLRAGGADLALLFALALANIPEALSSTAGMRLASRSKSYILGLFASTTLCTAAVTSAAFYFLSDVDGQTFAFLKAYGAGALISMTAETMIPEAFHNGPRYSGVLAGGGFAAMILIGELAK